MPVRTLLLLSTLCLAAGAHAQGWDPWRDMELREARADSLEAAAPEIRDPFFDFCIGLVEGDSLGVWTGADLAAHAVGLGRQSKLPLDRIVRIERRTALPEEVVGDWTARTDRRWRIELAEALALPLPYSILGYHPGTLHVSRVIDATEWNYPVSILRVPGEKPPRRVRILGITAVRIETGHFVLDVDGWLDRLLGKKLDDTWVEAFVLGRVVDSGDPEELGLQGIALGRSRDGRALSGAFDFKHDAVLPNGLPVARTLAGHCRAAVAPIDRPDPRAWSWQP